jgi:hypothetical protein
MSPPDASTGKLEPFFARWSRLKTVDRDRINHAVAKPVDKPHTSAPTDVPQSSPYLREGISEAEQIAALRRLWLTSPTAGASDGLDVYCADYSCAPSGESVGNVATTAEFPFRKGRSDE